MKCCFCVFIMCWTLLLGGCASSSPPKKQHLELTAQQELVILNDIMFIFTSHFSEVERPLQVVSEQGLVKNADFLTFFINKKMYEVCEEDALSNVGCDPTVSSFVVKLDPDLPIFKAGLSIDNVVQVSRIYIVSEAGNVVAATSFYVRASENAENRSIAKLTELAVPQPASLVNTPIHQPFFWQVQVLATLNRDYILSAQKALKKSGTDSVLIFEAPYYKLRVGLYTTKKSTLAAQKRLTKRYFGAFAVKVFPAKD